MNEETATTTHRYHYPTPTLTPPPAPTANNNPPLPSKTIIALGLGFIGAALAVVGVSFLIRANEVRLATHLARQRGETITFREAWSNSGGWWGTLLSEDTRWRRIRVRKERPPPFFWEVVMDRQMLDPQDEFTDDAQPLAAVASRATEDDPDDIVISALILLPSHLAEEEIPDLMIGTTHLRPTIPLAQAGFEDKDVDEDSQEYEIREVRRINPHWTMAWGLDVRIP